jgi:large subunit ribosomal protein L32
MAVPKRRMSKSRKHTRRAHDALLKPTYAHCPRCSQSMKPHTVCGNCGYYRGVMIVDMEAEAASAAKPKKSS